MAGYVNSWIEQYTTPIGCVGGAISTPITSTTPDTGTPQTPDSSGSDCALWVVVGVVVLMLAFEKKHKVSQ